MAGTTRVWGNWLREARKEQYDDLLVTMNCLCERRRNLVQRVTDCQSSESPETNLAEAELFSVNLIISHLEDVIVGEVLFISTPV